MLEVSTIFDVLNKVCLFGISCWTAVTIWKGIASPSHFIRVILYLSAFMIGMELLTILIPSSVSTPYVKGRCIALSSIDAGIPVGGYYQCGGAYFIATSPLKWAYESSQGWFGGLSRTVGLVFIGSLIPLKLKLELTKASFAGASQVFMAFLGAGILAVIGFYAQDIVTMIQADFLHISQDSPNFEGIQQFAGWMNAVSETSLRDLNSGGILDGSVFSGAIKLLIWAISLVVIVALSLLNLAIATLQGFFIVIFPLLICVMWLLQGDFEPKQGIGLLARIALLSCLGVLSSWGLALVARDFSEQATSNMPLAASMTPQLAPPAAPEIFEARVPVKDVVGASEQTLAVRDPLFEKAGFLATLLRGAGVAVVGTVLVLTMKVGLLQWLATGFLSAAATSVARATGARSLGDALACAKETRTLVGSNRPMMAFKAAERAIGGATLGAMGSASTAAGGAVMQVGKQAAVGAVLAGATPSPALFNSSPSPAVAGKGSSPNYPSLTTLGAMTPPPRRT